MYLKEIILIVATSSCVLAGLTQPGEEHVLELTDDDFSTRVNETETTLVVFYASWCFHFNNLKPKYAKAAEIVSGDIPPIGFAKINCEKGGEKICSKYEIGAYPTIKIFKNGLFLKKYGGPRDVDGIVKYMREEVAPTEISEENTL